jgi:hypothetical protein
MNDKYISPDTFFKMNYHYLYDCDRCFFLDNCLSFMSIFKIVNTNILIVIGDKSFHVPKYIKDCSAFCLKIFLDNYSKERFKGLSIQ